MAAPPADASPGAKVGKYCELKRIRFEGASTFSAEALRLGLQASSGFGEISHPFAPLADYLAAIETRTRTGYQHAGFPEATVAARLDESAAQIVVNVREGLRYHCGPVRVTGLKSMDPELIVKRLSVPAEPTQEERSVIVFENKDTSGENTEEQSNCDTAECFLWTPGDPAHLSPLSLNALGTQVSNVFWESGFARPRFSVRAVPHKQTGQAELSVDVQDEGPRAVIDRIEISGALKNSRKSLLNYLKLKPGLALTSNLVSQTELLLWNAARFTHYEVATGTPDEKGRATLKIMVMEYKDAPPLDREFSPVEKAMLRARQWWSSPEITWVVKCRKIHYT